MPSHKNQRTNEEIKRELSAIIREMKDPRLHKPMISIVNVETTSDLSYTKVFISSIHGIDNARQAKKILESAVGFVRKELGLRLKLRKIPMIIFEATDSIEYSANISKMLDDLR